TAPGFDNPQLRRFVIDSSEVTGPADIDATITDDDTSAFDIRDTGADTKVFEGVSGDKVDVRLATHPYSAVDVTDTADPQSTVEGGQSTTETIQPGERNVAHLGRIDAVNDTVLEGPHQCKLTFDAASDDSLYDQLPAATKQVDIVDDEVAGVDVKTFGGV